MARLSGGTQHKVLLARWLAAGVRVLLIPSELPEVLGLATRVLVLREGRIVGEAPAPTATQDGILRLVAGL